MSGVDLALRRPADAPAVGAFEFLPAWLFYAPIVAQWIWLGLRHGDFSLPTAANPHIAVGGLCGEAKAPILDQVAGESRRWIAPYIRVATRDVDAAEQGMAAASLAYPVVAKPDIGCNGTGVRLIAGRGALENYLAGFPAAAGLLLQKFVAYEGEAGLFYIRAPGAATGRLTSLTLKEAPAVTGDGRQTLRDLILGDPRARAIRRFFIPRLGARLDEIPRPGERVRLVFVGNHCKGSTFQDACGEITPAMTARIDEIARAMPEFHFGRFDVRYRSLAALKRGEDFSVIEINGVGSEATHVWDPRTRLPAAWRDQFFHYGAAFAIGRANVARGFRSSGLGEMFRHWRRQTKLLAAYPAHD